MIIDSCVLIDIFTKDEKWFDWSYSKLTELYKNNTKLLINPIIFAEVGINFDSLNDLQKTVSIMKLTNQSLSEAALFNAGRAFYQYKRKHKGSKNNVLPDFFIGAQADDISCEIITRDVKKFRSYFPKVKLIHP